MIAGWIHTSSFRVQQKACNEEKMQLNQIKQNYILKKEITRRNSNE